MLVKFTIISVCIFIVGYLLTLLLYHQLGKKLRGSTIEIKILLWIPIFALVILFASVSQSVQKIILLSIIFGILLDLIGCWSIKKYRLLSLSLAIVVSLGTISSYPVIANSVALFLAVWFGSVVSDVTAFFLGNYFGKHKLPKVLNNNKSWEGVAGQVLGATLGIIIFSLFISNVSLWLVLIVGLGSAWGDLMNSYVKRKLQIKDWSNRIPGHGGFIDRLSSLSVAMLLTYLLL